MFNFTNVAIEIRTGRTPKPDSQDRPNCSKGVNTRSTNRRCYSVGVLVCMRREHVESCFAISDPDADSTDSRLLRKIYTLVEDEALIEVLAQAPDGGWPQSRRRGRPGHRPKS